MEISQSDKVLATVKQVTRDEVYCTTRRWENISEFIISEGNESKDVVPGQDVPAEIERIEGETAYARTPRAPYARYIWPGDTIEITLSHFSDDGLAAAKYSGVNCERIHVIGAVPGETVLTRIIKVTGETAIGEGVEARSSGLDVGERLKATVLGGSSVAQTPYGTIDLELATEAYVSSKVTVEITDLDGKIEAEIIEPGVLPVSGNEVTACVQRDSKTGEVVDGNYRVRLSEPALATGEVRVRIDQVEQNKAPKSSVVSYNSLVPDVGETVRVWSLEGTSEAKPIEGSYRVQLPTTVPVRARFDVEITGRDGKIEGQLADVGSLPAPGNEVEAEVKSGESRTRPTIGDYPIELSSPALITGRATIAIDSAPADGSTEGHIVSYEDQLPAVGDTVTVHCRPGQSTVEPADETYRIELDETPPIEADLEIKITAVRNRGIRGTVVEDGTIPEEGTEIKAKVHFEKTYAKASDGYEVELDSPSLASGRATIHVDETTDSKIRGSIIEHHSVPDVGDTIDAEIDVVDRIATPVTGRYEVHLRNPSRDGRGTVEITAVDGEIRGKVLEMDSRNTKKTNPLKRTDSKNDLISGGKL